MPRTSTKRKKKCPTCGSLRNPAELLLMGANPAGSAYDRLSRNEKLAFGRLGLGKAQIRTEGDVEKARRMVREANRLRNRLPNPSAPASETDSAEANAPGKGRFAGNAEAARDLREGFSGEPSTGFYVANEPHVPAGDYTDCGEFIAVAVKPTATGEAQSVQEISFPGKRLELVSDPAGTQLFIVGVGQVLTDRDLKIFTSSSDERVLLGECRVISYGMAKFGAEVPESARGEDARWDHKFGEEGGTCPQIWYDRKWKRLILGQATYRIEGAWIRN